MYNILPNSVAYFGKSYDPLFPATGSYTSVMSSDEKMTIYFGDKMVTTLVCHDQIQYCNPQNNKCTPETYPVAAAREALETLGLNAYQIALVWRIGLVLVDKHMFESGIGALGVSGKSPSPWRQ